MSDTRKQEYLSGLRAVLEKKFTQKGWTLTDVSRKFKIPKGELDRLIEPPFGMISVRRKTISILLRVAYRRPNFWDAHTVRMLRACRDYEELYV